MSWDNKENRSCEFCHLATVCVTFLFAIVCSHFLWSKTVPPCMVYCFTYSKWEPWTSRAAFASNKLAGDGWFKRSHNCCYRPTRDVYSLFKGVWGFTFCEVWEYFGLLLLNRWVSERISFPKLDYVEPTREGGSNFVRRSFCKHESLGVESDTVRWRWELGFAALCVQRFTMGLEVEGVSSNTRTPLRYWVTLGAVNRSSPSACLLYSTFSMLMLANCFPIVLVLLSATSSPFPKGAWSSSLKCSCISFQ